MGHFVAAGSGGYQAFTLRGTEWGWLVFALICAVVSLVTALLLMRNVLAADEGTPKMREIARAIQEGAQAYLKRQYKTIGLIVIPLAVLVFLTSTKVVNTATNHTVLGFVPSGIYRTLVFLVGATFSGLAGFIGMSTAVRGNVRTAAAARTGSLPAALRVAIRTGGVTGLFVVGFGLLGATVIVMLAQHSATAILVGFGFGGFSPSHCSCASGAAFSPRRPTSGATSWARSRRVSLKTTPAMRRPSPTTWVTTSATVRGWRPTCSSPTG